MITMDLKERVVLITGGSRGIGKELVRAFCAAGAAAVVFTYRGSEESALALTTELNSEKTKVEAVCADVADFEAAQTLVEDLVKRYGRLDVLINNAGITRDNLLLRMSEAQWDEVLATNLKGVFNYTRAATKTMLKQKCGCMINISSVVGVGGQAGQANYAASKAGILGFSRSMAKELGSRGIRVNAVAPGFIETEMTEALPPAETQKWLDKIPLGRAGKASEVAALCVFLASDLATYLTGQTIRIDGGIE